MWPQARTALLVIHGVGQQSPFDTLDGFVGGLREALAEEGCVSIESQDQGTTENRAKLISRRHLNKSQPESQGHRQVEH